MDLAFTAEEEAFAARMRAWLAANVEPPPFAGLDDEIAWGRGGRRGWPPTAGSGSIGRRSTAAAGPRRFKWRCSTGNTPAARAPQPVNRVGINLAGPTLLAHGTDAQKARWLPAILDAGEIWCQLFSEPGAGSDLRSLARRAVGRREGWLVSARRCGRPTRSSPAGASASRAPIPTPRSTRASPISSSTCRRRASRSGRWSRSPATPSSTRCSSTSLRAARSPRRRPEQRLGRGQHHPGPRAGDELPVQGTGRARGVPRRAVRARVDSARVSTTSTSPTRWRRRSSSCASCGCTTGARCRVSPAASSPAGVEPRQAGVDRHDPDICPTPRLLLQGAGAPLAGPWQRQWLWTKAASIAGGTSEVQRTIIGDRLLGLPRG